MAVPMLIRLIEIETRPDNYKEKTDVNEVIYFKPQNNEFGITNFPVKTTDYSIVVKVHMKEPALFSNAKAGFRFADGSCNVTNDGAVFPRFLETGKFTYETKISSRYNKGTKKREKPVSFFWFSENPKCLDTIFDLKPLGKRANVDPKNTRAIDAREFEGPLSKKRLDQCLYEYGGGKKYKQIYKAVAKDLGISTNKLAEMVVEDQKSKRFLKKLRDYTTCRTKELFQQERENTEDWVSNLLIDSVTCLGILMMVLAIMRLVGPIITVGMMLLISHDYRRHEQQKKNEKKAGQKDHKASSSKKDDPPEEISKVLYEMLIAV